MRVGAFYVLENMKVKNIVIGVQAEKYENCVKFMKFAKKKNVKVIALKAGDIFKLDKETCFETIFPELDHTILENKINNNSLVLKLVYKDFSMLFTGDIEDKLGADILKIAHHGSKTSSTETFIEFVKPKIALTGVGENNNFGHPNEEVIKRFETLNTKVYRTDINGEISIKVDGGKILVECFRKEGNFGVAKR